MLRYKLIGAVIGGVLLAGCSGHSAEQDDGWDMIVAEDYSNARAHYQSLLADDPNNPYVNLNLGVAYEELGDLEMAAKHYQVALANGEDVEINEVARDGNTAGRNTTVADVAQENLNTLGS